MKVEDANSEGIRGWGCTPPGEPPPATVTTSATVTTTPPACLPPFVTRGWRRNALYGIIVFLIILVFLNIALTLWIISTLKLSAVSSFRCFVCAVKARQQCLLIIRMFPERYRTDHYHQGGDPVGWTGLGP